MKNSTVERPTTLIKISKSEHVKNIVEETFNKQCNNRGIDFYNLDDENDNNFDDSIMFNKMYLKDTNGFKNFAETKLLKKIDRLDFPLNCYPEKMSNLINMGIETSKFFSEINIENKNETIDNFFILTALKFDLRVKNFEIIDDNIFVYFFNEGDAISFYKQYYNFLELSFLQFCNWSFVSSPCIINKADVIYERDESAYSKLKVENFINITYGRTRFNDLVDHYNQLKSEFPKSELVKMVENLENGKTNFVFTNTKELAVGSKSNKIMQDAIKIMSGDEINKIYDLLEYDIVPIAATKHGAYTVQTLLNYSTNISHKKMISKYFAKEGEFLLAHEIGNYTFQKLLSFDYYLVASFFISNFNDVVECDLGLKVFRRCSEYLTHCKEDLLNRLNNYKYIPSGLLIQLKQIIINL